MYHLVPSFVWIVVVFIGEFIYSIVEILVFVCREGLVSGGIGDRLLHLMRCYRGAINV